MIDIAHVPITKDERETSREAKPMSPKDMSTRLGGAQVNSTGVGPTKKIGMFQKI